MVAQVKTREAGSDKAMGNDSSSAERVLRGQCAGKEP